MMNPLYSLVSGAIDPHLLMRLAVFRSTTTFSNVQEIFVESFELKASSSYFLAPSLCQVRRTKGATSRRYRGEAEPSDEDGKRVVDLVAEEMWGQVVDIFIARSLNHVRYGMVLLFS